VTDPATPARLKGYALRLLPAANSKISVSMLRELFAVGEPVLSQEVVRTLASRNSDEARTVLAGVAGDTSNPADLRADAIAGLATSSSPEHRTLLLKLAADESAAVRNESLRALRLAPIDTSARESLNAISTRHPDSSPLVRALIEPASINAGRPAFDDTAGWLKRLAALPGKADPEAGRRIFFHPGMAMCATCHRHSGRGNVVGPDLSLIARQGDGAALLRSILEPNREVAPQFYPTLLKLTDGTDFTGILLRSSNTEVYRDITGLERTFQKADIVERTELKTSLMPPGLVGSLTDMELRDLLAFLTQVP
jgi:putative heme-binding domain-containing protein